MTQDQIKQVVDEVFSALETATLGNFFAHFAVSFVKALVDALLPSVVGKLTTK